MVYFIKILRHYSLPLDHQVSQEIQILGGPGLRRGRAMMLLR